MVQEGVGQDKAHNDTPPAINFLQPGPIYYFDLLPLTPSYKSIKGLIHSLGRALMIASGNVIVETDAQKFTSLMLQVSLIPIKLAIKVSLLGPQGQLFPFPCTTPLTL